MKRTLPLLRVGLLKVFVAFFLSSVSMVCIGQVQTIYVKPHATDAGYAIEEDSSAVSRNASTQTNKLFLFIGGTGSSSSGDYNALRLHAASLGFDFINLSYPNSVVAASLAGNSDSLAFNKYRQEVCFGTPVSNDVSVDTLNSVYTRTLKLLQYLQTTYPAQNWQQYIASPTTLDWSKIIVGGHSQGSGHACYLAKQYLVDRVLMFSGPNDYSGFHANSANWTRQAGVTPVVRHYSYLSLHDEAVAYSKQYDVIEGLGMLSNDDSTYVDNLSSPYGNSRCLYTTQAPGLVLLHHNVPIKLSSINNNVWTYMLTSPIALGLENYNATNIFEVFPNPASNSVSFTVEHGESALSYTFYNIKGQLVKTAQILQHNGQCSIDIPDLKTGLYVLNVNERTARIIKQ